MFCKIYKGAGNLHITSCIGMANIAAVIIPTDTPVDTLHTANN